MVETNYPASILPKIGWRIGISGKDILNYCPQAVIGRRIDGSKELCLDDSLGGDTLRLTEAAFPVKRVPNLSTNLLGACFELKDFCFNTKNEGKVNWDGTVDPQEMLLTEDNYEQISTEMFIIGWPIDEIDGIRVPYQRPFVQKKAYEEFKILAKNQNPDPTIGVFLKEYDQLGKDKNGNNVVQLQGELRLNHCPTNLNYWHFTLDLYPIEDPDHPIEKAKDSWRKLFALSVLDILQRTFYVIPDQLEPTPISNWQTMVQKS